MMAKTAKPRYSGRKSAKFWKRVNRLRHPKDRDLAYVLGALLQNMERTSLRVLEALERREKQ